MLRPFGIKEAEWTEFTDESRDRNASSDNLIRHPKLPRRQVSRYRVFRLFQGLISFHNNTMVR